LLSFLKQVQKCIFVFAAKSILVIFGPQKYRVIIFSKRGPFHYLDDTKAEVGQEKANTEDGDNQHIRKFWRAHLPQTPEAVA
jgi:hypothetical protein